MSVNCTTGAAHRPSTQRAKLRRTNLVKLTLICCIFLMMATLYARAAGDSIEKLADDPACVRALAWIEKNSAWVTDQQIHLTEIPAPEFKEAPARRISEENFRSRRPERPDRQNRKCDRRAPRLRYQQRHFVGGASRHRVSRWHRCSREAPGNRLTAPGIADNGAGLAALAGLARALNESRIHTTKTIVLAGDVGEEGEGNLRGIRALVESYGSRLAAVIAVDGASTEHITTQGIASHRFEIAITGPGGHSWSDFGAPNPITALSRGIVKFSALARARRPAQLLQFRRDRRRHIGKFHSRRAPP